jgi:hypothetical protein
LPPQLRGEPADEQDSGRSKARRERDLNALDIVQTLARCGAIEELRDGEADLHEPRPVEVAKNDAVMRFSLRRLHEPHLVLEVAPERAVVDQPVDPRPELRIDRVRQFALPPEVERQIGIEVREDDAREHPDEAAAQCEGDLLRADLLAAGAADMAMRADPGLCLVDTGVRIGSDDDRAAGMLASQL